MPVQTVIKLRRDTAANWDTTNPVLAAGEMGIETDTGLHKLGNGTDAWGALSYAAASRMLQQVKNASGSSMPKGSVVYISGATGGDALVTLADADSEATSSKTLGFLAATTANDSYGNVIESGLLSGLDTSAATAGQSVWLSSTAGGFVFGAPPAKPAHSVYLGVVTRVHATEGEILVKVQNGYELNELHDVNAGSPTTGQVLQWDGSAWVNATMDLSAKQDVVPGVSSTEIGYLDGVTSSIQTQLNAKANSVNPEFSGQISASWNPSATGFETVTSTSFGQVFFPSDPEPIGIDMSVGKQVTFTGTSYNGASIDGILLTVTAIQSGMPVFVAANSGDQSAVNAYIVAINGFAAFYSSQVTVNQVSAYTITSSELSTLDGATSNLQAQINALASAPAGEAISSFLLMGA
jgi:hypothetical protein